jgi:azurin
MKVVTLFSVLLAGALVSSGAAAGQSSKGTPKGASKAAAGARTIKLTGTETMKYDVTTIAAKPGEQLHVVLAAVGSMPKGAMAHNFVLLQQGTDAMAFVTAGAQHGESEFIAPESKKDIIAATGMAGGGETVEVTFKAPAKRGTYTYLCTFPGHYIAGMKGTLVVK